MPVRRLTDGATCGRVPLACGVAAALVTATALLLLQACGSSPTEPSLLSCLDVSKTEPCDMSYKGTSLPRLTDNPPCPTRAEIEAVNRDIPVRLFSDPTAGVLDCREQGGSMDLTWAQKRVYQALLFLKRLRFDAPLPWTDKAVYDWLRETIPEGIVIESTGTSRSCIHCGGPVHIVLMSASQKIADHNLSIVDTPYAVIVHEARHAEGWGHSCGYADRTVAEMGASGVQYWLRRWIADHSDEPAPIREFNGGIAKLQLQLNFCCECRGWPLPSQATLFRRTPPRPMAAVACSGRM